MSSRMISTADLASVQFHSKSRSEIPRETSNSISFGSRRKFQSQSGGGRRAGRRIEAAYAPAAAAPPTETLYELLGIGESGSSFSDIKKAYREMARKYHPDVSPPERADEYTQRFIMVHEAYETLSDPQSRALYDRALSAAHHDVFSFSHDLKTTTWHSQLDQLQLQRRDSWGRSSWGARMRNANSIY